MTTAEAWSQQQGQTFWEREGPWVYSLDPRYLAQESTQTQTFWVLTDPRSLSSSESPWSLTSLTPGPEPLLGPLSMPYADSLLLREVGSGFSKLGSDFLYTP